MGLELYERSSISKGIFRGMSWSKFQVSAQRFNAVKDVMAQSIAAGDDIGASFAVSLDGEMVVDIWGGTLDAEGTQGWQQDTIVNVYSTTKPMSFL